MRLYGQVESDKAIDPATSVRCGVRKASRTTYKGTGGERLRGQEGERVEDFQVIKGKENRRRKGRRRRGSDEKREIKRRNMQGYSPTFFRITKTR